MLAEVETSYVKIWKEDGILYATSSDNLNIDLDTAIQCVHERIKFSNGTSYPCLFDMSNVRSANKQAREYMANEGAKYVRAGALLVDSPLTKTIGNIFLTVNKPPVPTKLFTDETEAKNWLTQYL